MTVTVVVPWSAGCPHREAAWAFVRDRYVTDGFEIVTGASPPGPFNRSAAIIDGARRATGDVLVVADADVFAGPLDDAIGRAEQTGWAVPHRLIHRLSPESTRRVLDGQPWAGLPLSTDNPQDRRPYRGNDTGTLLVIRRDVLFDVPPDVRFVGWGSEDQAWSIALRTLVGPTGRGGLDLVHLWHPPQPRLNRVTGTVDNRRLLRRYQIARHRPGALRELITEGVNLWTSCLV